MNKKIKCLLLVLLIVPCLFLIEGCNRTPVVVNFERSSASTSMVDVYTITYSDGSTSSFSVENGSDGKDLSIEDIYSLAKDSGFTGSFLDFVDMYLDIVIETDNSKAINKSLLSVVSVYTEINYDRSNFLNTFKDTAISHGSGVIYKLDKTTGDAYIITNHHVVHPDELTSVSAFSVKCGLYGSMVNFEFPTHANGAKCTNENGYPLVRYTGTTIDCTYIGGSKTYDIAVLKIDGSEILKNSHALEVKKGDSNKVVVGQTAIAIGNPRNWGISATEGIISVASEYAPDGSSDTIYEGNRVIRIDAAVNSGNSGGGLFNGDGELIGIVNAKIIDESIDNVAYAIPSSIAFKVADNIIANSGGNTQKAYKASLGITYTTVGSKAVYDEETGVVKIQEEVIIENIEENSIADVNGLKSGDKVLKITTKNEVIETNRLHYATEAEWLFEVGDIVVFNIEGKTEPINILITADCFKYVD